MTWPGVVCWATRAKISGSEEEIAVDGLFKHADQLKALVLSKGEFLRVQRRLGDDRMNEADIETLEDRLAEALLDRPGSLRVPTLPAELGRWGKRPRFKLDVAYSPEIAAERRIVQSTILGYLNLDPGQIPKGWFSRSKRIAPITVASSDSEEQFQLLLKFKRMLGDERERADGPLLPNITLLGELDPDTGFEPISD